MLRIDVAKVKPGMRLALPVQNPQNPSRTLLKVGFQLTPEIINRLKEYRIRSVWVRYPSLDFLDRFVNCEGAAVQAEVVGQITETFEALQVQSSAKLRYDTYTKTLEQMLSYLASNPQAAVFLGDLFDAPDDLMRHSSTVTYLSMLMGLKLESYLVKERKHVAPDRAKEVVNLGLGAMLHDVGVTQLDEDVRKRYEQTCDDSDPQWREHTTLGFQMVRGSVDPSAATIVLNHHQRWDGTGFAGKDTPVLSEQSIHVYARIAAVADTFDRMRTPPNMPPQPTVWVLNTMVHEPLSGGFDPQVLKALLAVVPPYPPGSIVRLNDGRHAVSIDHRPHAPCRPVVQVIPNPEALDAEDVPLGEIIDLSERSESLHVAEHDGQAVADHNFKPPQFAADLENSHVWM